MWLPLPPDWRLAGLHGVAHSLPVSRVLSPWWLAVPSIDGGGRSPFPGVAGRVAALMLPAVMGTLDCSPFPVAWCSRLPGGTHSPAWRSHSPGSRSPRSRGNCSPVALPLRWCVLSPRWIAGAGALMALGSPAGWIAPGILFRFPRWCVLSRFTPARGWSGNSPACRLVIPGAGVYR